MRRVLVALGAICSGVAGAPGLARDADPANSIYHLEVALTSQDGRQLGLDAYRGHPVLITMFYASCPAVCPLIVDTLRATEHELTPEQRARLRVLMISIDPERDSPRALRDLADTRHIDTSRWTLARTDAAGVRKIAALLSVQYRQLPNGDFNHSTVIALLSSQGEVAASTSTLGHADPAILARLK